MFSSYFDGSTYKDGEFQYFRQADAKKAFRTTPNVNLNDIATIGGEITLNLAVTTETRILSAPFKDQVIEDGDVRIQFKPSESDTLSYNISGDESRILAVRGLNKDKKHLSFSGGSSSGRFMGKGKSVDNSYQGQVKFVEVVLVKKSEQIKYPFSLTQTSPQHETGYPQPTPAIKPYSLKKFDQEFSQQNPPVPKEENNWWGEPNANSHAGPFSLKLFQLQASKHWGLRGTLKTLSPQITSMQGNLSALELIMENVEDANGNKEAINHRQFIALKRVGGHYMNGVYQPDPDKPYYEGQTNLSIKSVAEAPKSISGKLRLRFPTKVSTIKLKNLALGTEITSPPYKLRATSIGRSQIEFDLQGKREDLLAVNVFDESNKSIGSGTAEITQQEGDNWTLSIPFHGNAKRIELVIAQQSETRDLPLHLAIKSPK